MAAPARTKDERERDLDEVARLYLQGMTQAAIAAQLSKDSSRSYTVTQRTISRDMEVVRKRWLDSSLRNFDAAKAQELAKIDNLEREAWESWHRSIGTRRVTSTGRETGGRDGNKDKAQVRTEDMLGDPRYLAQIQSCIDRRCKLLGLDAPAKIAPTNPDGTEPYDGSTSDSAILASLSAIFEQAAAQAGAGAGGAAAGSAADTGAGI